MALTLSNVEKYHRRKKSIDKVLLSTVNDDEVIYGARAINVRVSKNLKRKTTDYDIYTKNPRKQALEAEQKLDKHMGFNAFESKVAQHKGTWKVKSRVTGEGVADYSKPNNKIPYDKIKGKKYIKISRIKQTIKKTLKDPESTYRHAKDKDALNRIKIHEKRNIKRKAKTKKIKRKTVYNNFNTWLKN